MERPSTDPAQHQTTRVGAVRGVVRDCFTSRQRRTHVIRCESTFKYPLIRVDAEDELPSVVAHRA